MNNINTVFEQWQRIIKLYRGNEFRDEDISDEETQECSTAAHFDVLAESITKLIT